MSLRLSSRLWKGYEPAPSNLVWFVLSYAHVPDHGAPCMRAASAEKEDAACGVQAAAEGQHIY
jgi:hypothetical protein